jgi:ketosteroid isomerase-like protein
MMPVVMKIRDLLPTATPSSHSAQPQPPAQVSPGSQSEVRKLEREWLDAYEQHDATAMNRIVADDFTITNSNGTVQTKADIMKMLGSPRPATAPSLTFSTEDVQARVDGDKVILSGRVLQKGERNGQQMTIPSRYTDTYVKRQGRWQVVASQLTRITQ